MSSRCEHHYFVRVDLKTTVSTQYTTCFKCHEHLELVEAEACTRCGCNACKDCAFRYALETDDLNGYFSSHADESKPSVPGSRRLNEKREKDEFDVMFVPYESEDKIDID